MELRLSLFRCLNTPTHPTKNGSSNWSSLPFNTLNNNLLPKFKKKIPAVFVVFNSSSHILCDECEKKMVCLVIIAFAKWCKEMMDLQNPHPTGSKLHQPFQTFVNNSTSNNLPPPKNQGRILPKTLPLQKKTVNPHHSTKPCQSASKHFILGSASWAMWSSFHYLSWCLRCWSFGSFNRPCHGQAKKRWTSAGLIFFFGVTIRDEWNAMYNAKWWYFLGGMKNFNYSTPPWN